VHRVLWQLERLLPAAIGGSTFGAASHLLTQLLMRRIVRALVAEQGIDVVHEPIPVSPKQPSAMYDVGAPVVIGPMNGGMEFPPAFAHMQRRIERLSLRAMRYSASAMNRLIPGKRRAAALLVANARTRGALPASVRHVPAIEMVENGVDLSRFAVARASESRSNAVRFAYVGRLIALKAVDALLEALALHARAHDSTLDIFGDGPERDRLKALATALGIGSRIRFLGFVAQADVAESLRALDALVLPSLHECGGAVVLEAMAAGLPVIATRWGGPADYLDESCGILIEPVSRPSFVAGLAAAMTDLAADPERRAAMGRAGRAKVERYYDWERKVDTMLEIYRMAADHRVDVAAFARTR
jgi:glycosyltransferase involved in cell wall biosynthesis